MSGGKKYPHHKRVPPGTGNIYFHMVIPAPLPDQFPEHPKGFVQVSTKEKNDHKAEHIIAPWRRDWIARIDAARKNTVDPIKAEILKLQRLHRVAIETGDDVDFSTALVQFLHDRALAPADWLDDGRGTLVKVDAIREAKTSTPFLAHIDQWKAAGRYSGQQLRTALAHINAFGATAPTIEALTSEHVQRWADEQLKTDTDATVKNKITSLRNYWSWMARRGMAPKSKPFWDVEVNGRMSPAERARNAPVRFEPGEIVKIWEAIGDDLELLSFVAIASYTGARREAIARLKVGHVFLNAPVPYFHIEDDKTSAGVRDVPIHSEIIEVMDRLVKHADKDGYLFHTAYKSEKRGDALGKKFSRLKTRLGFDHRRDFHSIRRTVLHLLETAHCPPNVAKDIVGHKKSDLTFGVYSGMTTLEQRRYWIENGIVYPINS